VEPETKYNSSHSMGQSIVCNVPINMGSYTFNARARPEQRLDSSGRYSKSIRCYDCMGQNSSSSHNHTRGHLERGASVAARTHQRLNATTNLIETVGEISN